MDSARKDEGSNLLPSTKDKQPRRFGVASELLNFLLVVFLGPVAVAAFMRWSSDSGPEFRVQYGDFIEERQIQCGRNLCPMEQVAVKRLKVQSLNKQPIAVKDVIVNDNPRCSANPLATLADALKAEGRDPGLLSIVPPKSSVTGTMNYGDVANVPLFGCEPLRVRIVTDRGEAVYDLE
jgi:hypothetical protein